MSALLRRRLVLNMRRLVMDSSPSALHTACHQAVKGHPGGAAAIAERHGLNARTLQNKLNASDPQGLSLKEFEAILKSTRSQLIVDALADLLR